jgi:uncharacterized repeat protein (TIGR03803 family)
VNWAIAHPKSVRNIFVVVLAIALVSALCSAQVQTDGAAAPSWLRGPQGAGAFPAANGPSQRGLNRSHRAASAQTAASAYTETVLYNFCSQGGDNCTDGLYPTATLIEDTSGNFYGTTTRGGANYGSSGGYFSGTVFKLTPNGSGGYNESVLYSFCSLANCADGNGPAASLIEDTSDNLYGTTESGGYNKYGTVFKLAPNGDGSYSQSVLYSFCAQGGTGCTDGASPLAGLIEDASGNLYGTTYGGGAASNIGGTVFKLAPSGSGYVHSVLYSFCSQTNCADGMEPMAGLIEDASGNLYGTTYVGGTGTNGGTVFKLAPNGSGYAHSVLYSFCSQTNCADGQNPWAGLIADASGNLYGTTYGGGANSNGTVFKLTPNSSGSYTESVLYSLCSQAFCADGENPTAGLIEDASGNLYGTTYAGGLIDGGTVFELTPNSSGSYTEIVLYSFCLLTNCTDGWVPSGLIADASGTLYGTTEWGGTNDSVNPIGAGTVFKLSPPPSFQVSASPTILTIAVGQSGTTTLTITSQGGFNSTVSFTCSGLPAGVSCSFSPQTVMPSGSKSATTTLTITTTAPMSATRGPGWSPQATYALLLPVLGIMGAAARGKRMRRGLRLLSLLALLGLALALASCGGSSGNTVTPAGTSTVTVTAGVTGGMSQTAILTVTVTQ